MESRKTDDILERVASYYSAKLTEHGQVPQGVDWNGADSQALRFEQLCKIIQRTESFSVNDLGCGYGALKDYLRSKCTSFVYNGYDISLEMIKAAQERFSCDQNTRFHAGSEPMDLADYGIASGIFNVRLGLSDAEWRSHLERTLDTLDRTSVRGFAFNCLTSYADAEKMRDYLYYADPCSLFDLCKRRYSRHVALLHDYGLYEFTILVRKLF